MYGQYLISSTMSITVSGLETPELPDRLSQISLDVCPAVRCRSRSESRAALKESGYQRRGCDDTVGGPEVTSSWVITSIILTLSSGYLSTAIRPCVF